MIYTIDLTIQNVEIDEFTYFVKKYGIGIGLVDFKVYVEPEKLTIFAVKDSTSKFIISYSKSKALTREKIEEFVEDELKRKFYFDPLKGE